MTTKLILSALALSLAPLAGQATPYCNALLDPEQLSGKYKKPAPYHSSVEDGWIFTEQMLETSYTMKAEALTLLNGIAGHLEHRGITLAVMIAPPRTIVAGQEIVDASAGAGVHSVFDAQESFDQLIGQVRSTGAVVPNLLDVALEHKDSFYFLRDTHWTAKGAALSAAALANALGEDRQVADLGVSEMEKEKGSLATVVRKFCDQDPEFEAFPLLDFPNRGGELFADQEPSVTLVGASFSNRYAVDFYRFGDALAWALDKDISNMAVAGTAMIGMFEAFVLGGGLDQNPELIIWETPYTESFNSVSKLRQMLGALDLVSAKSASPFQSAKLKETIKVTQQPSFLVVKTASNDATKGVVEITLASGSTKTVKLERRSRVPAEYRSTIMATALTGFSDDIVSLRVELNSGASDDVTVELYRSTDQNG